VNGKSGSSQLLIDTIRGERALQLTLRRLLEFIVVVQQPGNARLGLEVRQEERSLRIQQVWDGPFKCWNDRAALDRQVRTGDFIVEVNGVRGTSDELLQAIHNRTCLQLQLLLCRGHGSTGPDLRVPSEAVTSELNVPVDGINEATSESGTDLEAEDSDSASTGQIPLTAPTLPQLHAESNIDGSVASVVESTDV